MTDGAGKLAADAPPALVLGTFRDHRDLSQRLARFDFESPAPGSSWDVVLCVGGSRFHAHRFMLGLSSMPLNAMLTGRMRESSQMEVTLNDVTSATMAQVLTFIYTGEVQLATHTVVQTLSAAEMYELVGLRELCKAFILQHAAHVFKPQMIEPLPEKLLCELIAMDDLQIRESALLDAILAWGEARLGDASTPHGPALQAILADILALIRFSSMSVRELYCKVKPLAAAGVIPEHYLTEALFYHLNWGAATSQDHQVRMTPRTLSTTMRKRKRVSFIQNVSFSEPESAHE
ncbi:hypothetical protein H310_00190 [Aphanomyces invadans]|uniref:BTB domain-containing protein n=1 Tax=Aphanomyces invadans TaxID=157072 RepID=A0A024UUP2_9STRA|nr:hypothetical protein H310_00190 [Aphanomyces invadans]ETW09675.1 hypothetical protein H310_00190 [Aphanomyces invadans]|eukprot:XP_008861086.1 hypothetical protein H310_00190 [Aphanomyces invadans]